MSRLTAKIAGEVMHLLPERAVYWEAGQTLFITDPHIGKVASLRAAGSILPGGSTTADLDRLSRLVDRTGPDRLVVLGDLYHARPGRIATPTAKAVGKWREQYASLAITLVPGNHDRWAGLPASDLGIEVVPEGHALGPFRLRHDPRPQHEGYVLAGHLHPGALLRGPGRERVRLPCFWVRPGLTVLPAFGSTTGLKAIDPAPDDRVFAIVDDEVIGL